MTAVRIREDFLNELIETANGNDFSSNRPFFHASPPALRGLYKGKVLHLPQTLITNTDSIRIPWYNDAQRPIWDAARGLFRANVLCNSMFDQGADGHTSWAELVSPDMIHWYYNRIPFYNGNASNPDMWGGCVIVDENNTAGFGAGAVIYFVSLPQSDTGDTLQCVSRWVAPEPGLAPIFDGIVLSNPGPGEIVHAPGMDFRDPRVDWDEVSGQWIMKISIGRGIAFYGSNDTANWTFISLIELADWQQIETPDMMPMIAKDGTKKWVMAFSYKTPYAGVGYLIGNWDGTTFTPDNRTLRSLTQSGDTYAQAMWQHGGSTYVWFWQRCWDYASTLPTEGFNSNLSQPVQLLLDKDGSGSYRLYPTFLDGQVRSYPEYKVTNPGLMTAATGDVNPDPQTPGKCWRTDCVFYQDGVNPWAAEIQFDFCVGTRNYTRLSFRPAEGTVAFDRSHSGTGVLDPAATEAQALFNRVWTANVATRSMHKFSLIVDVSSVEIIINDGEVYFSSLIFPPDEAFGRAIRVVGSGSVNVAKIQTNY